LALVSVDFICQSPVWTGLYAHVESLSSNNSVRKLFTPMCLCHQAVGLWFGTSQRRPCSAAV